MLIGIYCVGLLVLGYVFFCMPIGIIVFKNLCERSVYEKKSLVDSASHVKDENIMIPLLAAKERWAKNPIEKASIKVSLGRKMRFLFSRQLLLADLWINKDFQKNNKIAILVHGFTDSSTGLAYLAESYQERGISTLSINLRAHSESEGDTCGLGCYLTDGKDIAQWVFYLQSRFGNDVDIILHGISMGGSAVIQSVFFYSLPVKLVISDCTFSEYSKNVRSLVQRFFPKNFFSTFIVGGIYFFASISCYFANGFFFGKNNTKKIIKESSSNIPLLLFHGEEDTLVEPHCAQELYESANGPKELVIVKGAAHIGSWFYQKDLYMDTIFKYLHD